MWLAADEEVLLRHWSRYAALSAFRLFYSHRGVWVRLARSGAMIKAAYAVSYTPVREENTRETASPGSSLRAALFKTENRAWRWEIYITLIHPPVNNLISRTYHILVSPANLASLLQTRSNKIIIKAFFFPNRGAGSGMICIRLSR